jgi:hypothetical protein
MSNEQKIEQLLRQAPRPSFPPDLSGRLLADIRLPHMGVRPPAFSWRHLIEFRRAPAFSFALLLLLGIGLLARQSTELARLTAENEQLQAAQSQHEGLRHELDESEAVDLRELQMLRQQRSELLRLRAESAEIMALLSEAQNLRTENQNLKQQLAALGFAGPLLDAGQMDEVQQKAERIECVENLKKIGLSVRIWAPDNRLPFDYPSMQRFMSPKMLVCPGDKTRQPAENWRQFEAAHSSYELLSPGVSGSDPQAVYMRCPIHNVVLLANGSVHQLGTERAVVFENERWQVRRIESR